MKRIIRFKNLSPFLSPVLLAPFLPGTHFAWEIDEKHDPPVSKIYMPFSVGSLAFAGNPGSRVDGGSTVALGMGVGYRKSDHLAFEFEGFLADHSYDGPDASYPNFVATSGEMDLESRSVFFTLKGFYPMKRFEPYLGAGIGLNRSTLLIPGYLFGFIPGTVGEETEWSLALQLLGGTDIVINENWAIGFEFRRIEVNADFKSYTGGKVDIGGDLVAMNLKWRPLW